MYDTRDQAIVTNDRAIATSTVGFMCIAIVTWMLGIQMAGWYTPAAAPFFAGGVLYSLGSILLVIMGILTVIYGRNLDAIIFLSLAGLFFSLHEHQLMMAAAGPQVLNDTRQFTDIREQAGYYGWYAILWAVFFCYLWISSFGKGTGRSLFLLAFGLAALAEALSGWVNSHGLEVLSGYLLLITGLIAFIISASEIIRYSPAKFFHERHATEPPGATFSSASAKP